MKKTIRVTAFCIIVVILVYCFKNNIINFENNKFVNEFLEKINYAEEFAYTNDFKINSLQMKVADYYFNQLNDNQKKIYSGLALGVSKYETKITIPGYEIADNDTTVADVAKATDAFFADHPEVFYLNFDYKISNIKTLVFERLEIEVSYIDNKENIETSINDLDNIIKTMTKNLASSDDFDSELALHDELAKKTKYYSYTNISDIPIYAHTSYGSLIKYEAVCDGFTKAMQLLLDRVGIESILVSGMADNQAHAWNMVKLDNEWYHMDLTSDKLLKDSNGNSDNVVHSYFNITEEQILNSHTIDSAYTVPSATSKKENFYIKTNNYIYGTEDFSTKLKKIITNEKSSQILEFACDTFSDVPNKMTKVLYEVNFNGVANTRGSVSINYYNIINSYIVVKK